MKFIGKFNVYTEQEGISILYILPTLQISKDVDGAYGIKIGWLRWYYLLVGFSKRYQLKHFKS